MALDVLRVREQFPALEAGEVFLDNPGGTQISRMAMQAMRDYLLTANANHGGAFSTSRASDARVEEARAAMAAFIHARRPEEIVFGANMTTLTFQLSRSLGHLLHPGDTLAVTRLDHDANVSPWLMLAEEHECRVRWVDFHPEDGTLDLDDLRAALEERPRLLAVGYASNALGTINPVRQIVEWAHQAGALIYVDAVHFAPHGPIDVQQLDCDFLVCSAYKFFGPHLGILYGKYDLLEGLPAYRVRPAPAEPPGKFETGTGNFETISGLLGALDYVRWLGMNYGGEQAERYAGEYSGEPLVYKQAMGAVRAYEFELSRRFLDVLGQVPGLRLYGPSDPRHLEERVPTFSFTLEGHAPREVAERLGQSGLHAWDGNFYALGVTQRLGLEERGGLVRVGAAHYNTREEIDRLGALLADIARS
jgi:cysteine desulfurase family protein (TIGR01976 family)